MAIQVRRGNYSAFDKNKLLPGEWATCTDNGHEYVYMCFRTGVVFRMATYESFEQDMVQIQQILATCESIEIAVEAFNDLAEQHALSASQSATSASQSATACENYKNIMQDAIDTNIPTFTINYANGHLLYTGGTIVFTLNSEKHLLWEVQV